MPFVLCYTKEGNGLYPEDNYPGHIAYNCDWEHAMHLALSEDGKQFRPLRNNTGILFPKAVFAKGDGVGVTRTLLDPWLLRSPNGEFLVACTVHGQNKSDLELKGTMVVFASSDLIVYRPYALLPLSAEEIRSPRVQWTGDRYRIVWNAGGKCWTAESDELKMANDIRETEEIPESVPDYGIPGCVPGNVLQISEMEAQRLRNFLDEIRHIGTEPAELYLKVGEPLPQMPAKAACIYSDGSFHRKQVIWDQAALNQIDRFKPGVYEVPGVIHQKHWTFPIPVNFGWDDTLEFRGISDPCVTEYHGRYIMSSSGSQNIQLRFADTPEGTFASDPVVIYRVPLNPGETFTGTWAAEFHEIDGVPYLFTAVCPGGEWTRVKACVLRCKGDPENPQDWEAPIFCVRRDGSILTPDGISLDMTYFRDGGKDYVMWSDRIIHYDTDPPFPESANLMIAQVNPHEPWRLISDPVCILRPQFGWDRYETEVDEAPYLLRHGNELFVTFSGSSTSMGDLYNVGLLIARSGDDLLKPESWTCWPYPLLTKESVANEYGPGHNNFVKDPDTGDDLMVYHAIPHDDKGRTLYRQPGIRRVHWGTSGLPYLEMTESRDLNPELAHTVLKVTVQE